MSWEAGDADTVYVKVRLSILPYSVPDVFTFWVAGSNTVLGKMPTAELVAICTGLNPVLYHAPLEKGLATEVTDEDEDEEDTNFVVVSSPVADQKARAVSGREGKFCPKAPRYRAPTYVPPSSGVLTRDMNWVLGGTMAGPIVLVTPPEGKVFPDFPRCRAERPTVRTSPVES
jgi:hypothetical protein